MEGEMGLRGNGVSIIENITRRQLLVVILVMRLAEGEQAQTNRQTNNPQI